MKDTRVESFYYSGLLELFCVIGINKDFKYIYTCDNPKGFSVTIDSSSKLEVQDLINFLNEKEFEYLGKL